MKNKSMTAINQALAPSNSLLSSVCSIEPSLQTLDIFEIATLANKLDLSHFTFEDIHNTYYSWSILHGLNTSNGVVITPMYIADHMVRESVNFIGGCRSSLSWYDPCCGSGIFVEAILKKYKEHFGKKISENMPAINLCELSYVGIFLTLLTIKKFINLEGIDLLEYIKSDKLQIFCGDALTKHCENTSLFDEDSKKFDIVIGNPPYVRASRIPKKEKTLLKFSFPQIHTGNSDLYFYFIANGIEALKESGVLNFISPANFFRAKSAKLLREKIANSSTLLQLVDLDETKVFKNAEIHTSIYWLSKTKPKEEWKGFKYLHIQTIDNLYLLKNSNLPWQSNLLSGITDKGWKFLHDESDYDFNNQSGLVSLKNSGIKIYSGIRPGYKKAFVYSQENIIHLSNEIREKWFIPAMEAKDLSRWKSKQSGKYLLFAPKGCDNLPDEILDLLTRHKSELQKRQDTNSSSKWSTLRSCNYYEVFKNCRIVFPDISTHSRFSIEKSYKFNLDGSFIIESDSLALLGVLNSRKADNFYLNNCSSIGNARNNGRLRFKKNHIEEFLLPRALFTESETVLQLDNIVSKILEIGESELLMEHLNKLVDELYNEEY